MKIIIFILLLITAASLTFYFTLKRKVKCNKCSSPNITITGKKQYKEDPIALYGSPNSYEEIEYKCNACGNTFWEKSDAAIFN
jgi:DNA-directed RNA polymerase subunit RPC12/RpoP